MNVRGYENQLASDPPRTQHSAIDPNDEAIGSQVLNNSPNESNDDSVNLTYLLSHCRDFAWELMFTLESEGLSPYFPAPIYQEYLFSHFSHSMRYPNSDRIRHRWIY